MTVAFLASLGLLAYYQVTVRKRHSPSRFPQSLPKSPSKASCHHRLSASVDRFWEVTHLAF